MTSEDRRLKLSAKLHDILGTNEVYFDPPESTRMKYPAIVYRRSKVDTREADNRKYLVHDRFTVTLIRKTSQSDLADRILDEIPYCDHNDQYKSENLYHDIFTIYV